jgi:hypothetical protein
MTTILEGEVRKNGIWEVEQLDGYEEGAGRVTCFWGLGVFSCPDNREFLSSNGY